MIKGTPPRWMAIPHNSLRSRPPRIRIRHAKITAGHIDIVPDLWHRPAVYFFGRSGRAMSGSDRVCILIARIVEMYELLQALNVAVVKESLLEVGPGGFGSRTLWRCQCRLARRNHLHLSGQRLGRL